MILVTNGCSWTYGSGDLANKLPDEERKKLLWPNFLGQKIGANEVVNLSLGCGSNPRIYRTTFDWLSKQSPERLNETIAVIQFTEFSRFELYQPKNRNKKYECDEDRWMQCKVDCITSTLSYNIETIVHIVQDINNRLFYYTDIEGVYNFMCQISAITDMFKNYGIKKFFYWNNNEFYTIPDNYKQYMLKTFPFVFSENDWRYEIVGEKIHTNGTVHIDRHPTMPNGHKQIADYIYATICDKI